LGNGGDWLVAQVFDQVICAFWLSKKQTSVESKIFCYVFWSFHITKHITFGKSELFSECFRRFTSQNTSLPGIPIKCPPKPVKIVGEKVGQQIGQHFRVILPTEMLTFRKI